MTTQRSESVSGNVESDRAFTLFAYVLHLVGSVTALPSIVALVLNYLKREDSGAQLNTHHRYMIRTFWWALAWVVIGWITTVVLIGWVVLGLVWLWYLYRHVRGLIHLANGEPMPA
ncbi:MAG: hypothetical protein JXB36_13925 [Gammaproteobacteria bacterium]|nr:hypothetical protein [Gammaproteobacteria bacterium]